MLLDLVANILLLTASIVALVWFFKRRRSFPAIMIALLVGTALLVAIESFLGASIPAVQAEGGYGRELTRALVVCVIWVPYLLLSKRVKGTFVN